MLTKAVIRKKTNAASFEKGERIYLLNHIKDFIVDKDEEMDYIKANVKGSGRNQYEVTVDYDIKADKIMDIHCECPAFESYNGICKHCVATLMEYIKYNDRKDTQMKLTLERNNALEMLKSMKGSYESKTAAVQPQSKAKVATVQKQLQTTPAMKQLLTDHIRRRTLDLLPTSNYGQVCLEPILRCTANQLQLEFRIGSSQRYVLKDVFELDRALENRENVRYGQKLQFIHTIEHFLPESRPLVQFLRRWVQRNKNRYIQSSYYGYSYGYSCPKLRAIPLLPSDLEEVLEAISTGTILADVNDLGESEWRLAENNPPRRMTITGISNGIQVKINYLFGFQGNYSNIYFHDQRIYRTPHHYLEPIWDFLKCMADIPTRTVVLQREDVPVFCRELLPVLEQYFECTRENFDEKDYGVLPVSFEIYLDAPQRDFITCRVMAIYGEKQYNIYANHNQLQLRDQVKEAEVKRLVSSLCNAYDDKESVMVVAEDEDKLYNFLMYGISRLQEIGEVFVSEALKRLKIISAPKVSVGVAITGDVMNLSLTSDDISREQLLEILSKYNRKKKFYRLKNGDFVNVTGEELESLLELKKGLHLTDTQLKQSSIEIPRFRALYLDAELRDKASMPVNRNKEFKALVRNMKTVEDNDFDIPVSLENVLREYQKRGYLWIKTLQHNGFGGILADDMGLGKTLQVICYLLSEYLEAAPQDNRRALIVCPASLVYNWKIETSRFAPQLTVRMVVGTAQERMEVIQSVGNKDILITSYDLLKRDIEYYDQIKFHSQIIDEAQYIKNFNTQAARAVKQINSGFKLALTGTPIENRLSELWSIFDYLMPGFLYSYQRFRDELEIPIIQKGDEAAVRRLQRMITPFVLRRLKKDVLTDLPEKLEESIYAKMQGEQQKLYDAHVKKLQILLGKQSEEEFKNSKLQLLSELTKLRQLCCDPALLYEDYTAVSTKMELCMDLIQNAVSGGHKILLFSQFTSMLERLQQCLIMENISFYSLTGATTKENRTRLVETFNQDDTSVFCISLKAGGTGLNLTSADIVIHFDPWWNLAVQNQATDRAHRIGQKNIVSVYKLIVQGTVEENIMKLQDKKKDLAEQVLGGEGMNIGNFTREELLELLR